MERMWIMKIKKACGGNLWSQGFSLEGQIVVLELRSHIKPIGWSQKTRRDNAALMTATCHIRARCFLSTAETEGKSALLHLPSVASPSLVVSSQWHFALGHPRSRSSEREAATGCSCSVGLCLVSLTLSKADHTIPSTPPVGQERDPFTIHLPYRLPT